MLWKVGAIRRPGEVHEGSATMDGMDLERERGITINSAAIRFEWFGRDFALVDAPGHVDFSMEVERSMKAVDGAVLALCAVAGAQPQTESVWRRARKSGLGAVMAVNKMDREGADFENALASAKARLGASPLAVAIPIGSGPSFQGCLDLVGMRRMAWDREGALSVCAIQEPELSQARSGRRCLGSSRGALRMPTPCGEPWRSCAREWSGPAGRPGVGLPKPRSRVHHGDGGAEVAYAYRLASTGSVWGSFDKQTGSKGQFAKVHLELAPAPHGGALFESVLVGEAVPRKFVGAKERGVRSAMLCLDELGRPALGWRARLMGGQARDVDSSGMASKQPRPHRKRRAWC